MNPAKDGDRPVIFLDIDGVLVTQKDLKGRSGSRSIANPGCVLALNQILEQTGAYIVVSSSWRYCGMQELQLILDHWGVKGTIRDFTPSLITPKEDGSGYYSHPRCTEISTWMDEQFNGYYVVIDDDPDACTEPETFIQTTFEDGLGMQHVERAVKILKGEWICS